MQVPHGSPRGVLVLVQVAGEDDGVEPGSHGASQHHGEVAQKTGALEDGGEGHEEPGGVEAEVEDGHQPRPASRAHARDEFDEATTDRGQCGEGTNQEKNFPVVEKVPRPRIALSCDLGRS